jgi:L-methionine (R)-S-oxide reductase
MQQVVDIELLVAQGRALIDGERDFIANAANLSALLYDALPDVNWVGVYLLRGNELVLGPFQGKPACTRIAIGAGVCGSAVAERRTLVVPDVHAFPGHIACDSASRSEIVVPLIDGARVIGVLDVDSPIADRFHDTERALIEAFAQTLVVGSDF